MTVTTSDADWAALMGEHARDLSELYELRKLRDAHDAQWKSLSRKAEAGARDAALWRSQFEDAQRMLEQLRGELGRERGLRVNAVAACKAVVDALGRVQGLHPADAEMVRTCIAVIAEAERHG